MKARFLIDKIRRILVDYEESRDDLLLTIKMVHDSELEILNVKKEQYYDVLFDGQLSSVHTIKRLWQFIQEKLPELRGKNWIKRQVQSGQISKEFANLSNEDLLDFLNPHKQLKLFNEKN